MPYKNIQPTISLIITTYNWKEALNLVIKSALEQTLLPNEIIIADDGSDNDTRLLVETYHEKSPIPIVHSWQEDVGFRASMSRNKAIAIATSDYIVVIDGDIILHQNFIADHIETAHPNRFVAGRRVMITKNKTKQIIENKIAKIGFLTSGIINRKNTIHSGILSKIFSKETKSLKGIKTCNLGFWREDAIRINGFNEDFNGWGLEDSDFAARLIIAGITAFTLRFKANCFHLYHNENTRNLLAANNSILQTTISQKKSWCNNGIDKYLKINKQK
jgi:glycosyltransferase involved in cell wall biosynthesis